MYQLRNLIARNVVPHDPEKNMNAAEDFMLLLLHSHVVAAARVLQLENPTTSLKTLANRVISRFVRLPNLSDQATADCTDGVYSYAVEVLSMGLLWHGFHDAIKEGDGERILRYWKFLLVIFKSTRHKNYAKESVILLHQYYYQLSDRQKMQLLWSRCVNTQGRQGCNIPCDLYMEHLNRRFKTVLRGMGSSITLARVRRAGQSIQFVHKVCETFEKQTAKRQHSDHHPYPSFGKDFQTVIKVLLEENVFTEVQVRQHSTFKFRKGLIEALSRKELAAKVNTSLKQL